MGVGYFTILIGGISVFFIRRKRYTGWFPRFYDRMEKFYSEYDVWRKYSVEKGYDTIDAIIAYGNENQSSFVKKIFLYPAHKRGREGKEIKDSRCMVDDHNWRDRNRADHFIAGEYCVRNRTKEK